MKKDLNEDDREELDRIDEQSTGILLFAESKLQMHMTDDRFSEKLHEDKNPTLLVKDQVPIESGYPL